MTPRADDGAQGSAAPRDGLISLKSAAVLNVRFLSISTCA
jgi:hypothetical protein